MTNKLAQRKYYHLKSGLNAVIKDLAKEKRKLERSKDLDKLISNYAKILVLDRVIGQLRYNRDFAQRLK